MTDTLPLFVEMVGVDYANCSGITATGQNALPRLCAKLIDAGHDRATPLEAYSGGELVAKVKSLGAAERHGHAAIEWTRR